MIRSEVLKTLIPVIHDELVVCNIGLPSQELHMHDDQPSNFYMLGTMGLASSIGLGLALSQKAAPQLWMSKLSISPAVHLSSTVCTSSGTRKKNSPRVSTPGTIDSRPTTSDTSHPTNT